MPKAVLEFNLDDGEDKAAHLRCIKADDMALFLWELLYNSKKGFEYKLDAGEFVDQYALLDAFYEWIWEKVRERGIDLEEIIE